MADHNPGCMISTGRGTVCSCGLERPPIAPIEGPCFILMRASDQGVPAQIIPKQKKGGKARRYFRHPSREAAVEEAKRLSAATGYRYWVVELLERVPE